jgi:uncharacterized RDD family membrane protein YckC
MGTADGSDTLYCAECGRPSTADELARFGDLLICSECKDRYAQKLREGAAPAGAVRYGGFWLRVVAALLDGIILVVVDTIFGFALRGVFIPVVQQPTPGDSIGAIFSMMGPAMIRSTLVNLAINGTYEIVFLWKLGFTPGKAALGLRVARPDGSPLGLGRSIGRYFSKVGEAWILVIGWIGYIVAGIDAQKRAVHDMICDTRVFKTR